MTQHELDRLVVAHEQWFHHPEQGQRLVLIDADLRGMNLIGKKLYDCKMDRVDLTEASMEGTSMLRAELSNVNFTRVYGRHAEFTDSKLRECSFLQAELFSARFDGVYSFGSHFVEANLSEAFLVKANMFDGQLNHVRLHSSNCRRLCVLNCSMVSANLVNAVCDHAMFRNVDLRYADVQNTQFSDTRFDGIAVFQMGGRPSDLTNCVADHIDFSINADGSNLQPYEQFTYLLQTQGRII